jgi:acetyl esterase
MPLDPIIRNLLDAAAKMDLPPFESLTPDEARARILPLMGTPEEVARTQDRSIPGPNGDIPVRTYWPAGEAPLPLLVYFHGGGWVIGSIESHDMTCRSLANASGCAVVSVDYRLAPEHTFPAPLEDCYAAAVYIAEHAAEFDGDGSRLAVGGDSAGGNLAAAVSLMARDRGGPSITFQLLVYPVTDRSFGTASYRENADGYFLTTAGMRWFWNHYLRDARDGANPYASPLRADSLRGLPSVLVITAEFDPLRDEGEAYAARLREAGVTAVTSRYDGVIHGFVSMAALVPQGQAAIAEAGAALRSAFTAVPVARR